MERNKIGVAKTWIFFDLDEISESADFKFWVSYNIFKEKKL